MNSPIRHLTAIGGLLAALAVAVAGLTPVRAKDFRVTTAQELQNALTEAAGNGADDTVWLAKGYYAGNFNFNGAEARALTLRGELGTTNTQITVDGTGTGLSLNLTSSANAAITVLGITFVRNGNTGLRVATGTGADVVVEDCLFVPPATGPSGTGLELASGQSATVRRCTAAGLGRPGTGINIQGFPAGATVTDSTFSTNTASIASPFPNNYPTAGGGLYVSVTGPLTVANSTFSGNVGSLGASAYGEGSIILVSSNVFMAGSGASAYFKSTAGEPSVTATGNTFTRNRDGAALWITSVRADQVWNPTLTYVYTGEFSVYGNVFVGNLSEGFSGSAAVGTFTNNTFSGNLGGGASLSANNVLDVVGNTFTANGNLSGDFGSIIGGAYCEAPTLRISHNSFTGNKSAAYYGGGLGCGYSTNATISDNTFTGNSNSGRSANGGGGICFFRSAGAIELRKNAFSGNSTTASGGGINCVADLRFGNPQLTLTGNVFRENAASGSGGAVYAAGERLTIQNNLVARNSSGPSGGGLWLKPQPLLDMVNNTVFGNTNAGNGGGVAFQVDGLTEILHVYNNIIWGNGATGNGADVWLAGTGQRKEFLSNNTDSVHGVWDLALNNPNVDPQFFDPINGDFHLRPTSGCVNVGMNDVPALPATDLDGGARIAAGKVDLGCYEFANAAYHPADTNTDLTLAAGEFSDYAAAWKNSRPWLSAPSPIPANYVTRAGFLQQAGGVYHNDGSAPPTNWKPGKP